MESKRQGDMRGNYGMCAYSMNLMYILIIILGQELRFL